MKQASQDKRIHYWTQREQNREAVKTQPLTKCTTPLIKVGSDQLNDTIRLAIGEMFLHPVSLKFYFFCALFKVDAYTYADWDSLFYDEKLTEITAKSNHQTHPEKKTLGIQLSDSDFEWTVTNPNGITLKDVAELCYRLKSYKYNADSDIVELFDGITNWVWSDNNTKMSFDVTFDYSII